MKVIQRPSSRALSPDESAQPTRQAASPSLRETRTSWIVVMFSRAASTSAREHKTEDLVDGAGRDFRPQIKLASRELRDRTLGAVEAVLDWRRAVENLDDVAAVDDGAAPPPFLWEGQNYLVRLAAADDIEQLLLSVPDAGAAPGGAPGGATAAGFLADAALAGKKASRRWQQLAVPAVPGGVMERSERVINSVEMDVVLTRPLGPVGDGDCTVSPVTMATPTRLQLHVTAAPTLMSIPNLPQPRDRRVAIWPGEYSSFSGFLTPRTPPPSCCTGPRS